VFLNISKNGFYTVSAVLLALVTLAVIHPDCAHAAAASVNHKMPWDTSITQQFMQNKIMIIFSVILTSLGLASMYLPCGTITERGRSILAWILVFFMVIVASQMIGTLFAA
jgi:uncharacterized membrane protein YjgN (DUF898 family)